MLVGSVLGICRESWGSLFCHWDRYSENWHAPTLPLLVIKSSPLFGLDISHLYPKGREDPWKRQMIRMKAKRTDLLWERCLSKNIAMWLLQLALGEGEAVARLLNWDGRSLELAADAFSPLPCCRVPTHPEVGAKLPAWNFPFPLMIPILPHACLFLSSFIALYQSRSVCSGKHLYEWERTPELALDYNVKRGKGKATTIILSGCICGAYCKLAKHT